MTLRRDFLAFTAGAVAAKTVLPVAARAEGAPSRKPSVLAHPLADQVELLTRYDAWLDAERLALMQELYPSWDPHEARRFIPCEAFVNHWWDWTPPSTRVLAVLGAAGIYTGPDTVEARKAAFGSRS